MTAFKDLSIRSKLTWLTMLTICLALLLACAGFVAYELFDFRKNLVADLSTFADFTARSSVGAIDFNNAENGESMLANLRGETQIAAACIYKDGRPWAKYPRSLSD